ncbi:uncharacterized protein si:dkey-187a12.4 [Triplophysa rosa]|uniref:DUF4806 domain-containing protein n=1 Tax=Triplophysa rosa TaxID=992332 RepID=A0A9W8C192_TRIRA|nr:uncharacterized protein si:dkey-187a12.4 [Triplophysa rosa]KAI7805571.1 hypothetical protein IRJ41_011298 [Triplophysa rosa]
MEANNVSCSDWAVNRRAEGLVNKQEDMALGTVQGPSENMHPLPIGNSSHIPGQAEMNFHKDSESFKTAAMTVKCMHEEETSPSETAAYRQIISLLVEIKEEQQRQWAVLKDLQARVHGQVCEEEEEELDMDLPLLTMEQLDKTERHLEDSEAQRRMVSHLSRMGGATVDDAVRRLMLAVLSYDLGSELNWVGRGQKRSFRNTRLQGVLFRALKRTPVGKEATHHQFADVVKKWLRFAPFRQRGSGRRQHLKPVEFMCPKYHSTLEDCNLEPVEVQDSK